MNADTMGTGSQSSGGRPFDRLVRSVLISPPAMAFKEKLRDAVWTVRGRQLRNPPLPRHPRSVLFVCLGNICRSPFAALLAARLLEDAGLADIRCSSAGLRTSQSAKSPREASAAAREFGVSLEAHRPVLLTNELVASHDMIIAMEPLQVQAINRRWPAQRSRVFLLPLFETDARLGAFERCHLIDPFGRDDEAFQHCYRRIDVAVRQLVDAWRSQQPVHAQRF